MTPLVCGATIGHTPDSHGSRAVTCRRVLGLRSWLDASGQVRAACSAPGHDTNVRRRFGLLVDALREEAAFESVHADLADLAEAEGLPDVPLAAWTEAECRAAWGDR
jgi:hypothetical protein